MSSSWLCVTMSGVVTGKSWSWCGDGGDDDREEGEGKHARANRRKSRTEEGLQAGRVGGRLKQATT